MKSLQALLAGALMASGALARELCTASQKCWPSSDVWSLFNACINGRLIAPHPPAWPCHDPNYDEAACLDAKAHWNSFSWRSNQVGATQDIIWDSFSCDINAPRNETCKQGLVPTYSVAAREASVRGYAQPSSLKFKSIAIHPNSPDVATTNATLQPIFDWISKTPTHNIWGSDVGFGAPLWIGGRLISRDAFEKNSAKLVDLAVNPAPGVWTIINIIGGGVISKVAPESRSQPTMAKASDCQLEPNERLDG
ncbi:hypothetical protein FRC08_007084 [Ceratobasidium sp. 394]|nr:hypothetical protein FRC08_007084 [Ceratobasidium sp. 394]